MIPMTLIVFLAGFFGFLIVIPILFGLIRTLGLYTIVYEGECKVYVLFGKVLGILQEPGLHILLFKLGLRGLIVNWLGQCHTVDMRLDQQYLRSQPVNSEEGAPVGIGIWYEMFVSDPLAYIFKNADPRGSLSANVSNSTVRCLSNMPLAQMLETRHAMSQTVRAEVSPKSNEWGYKLGSVYIRKVHFRDAGMIKQIEAKVVNRLRQVTSAIKQEGANQVNLITSAADRQAAIQLGIAAAMRPKIVGAALEQISRAPEISDTMFEILENQQMLAGQSKIALIPEKSDLLAQLLVSEGGKSDDALGAAAAKMAKSAPPVPDQAKGQGKG